MLLIREIFEIYDSERLKVKKNKKQKMFHENTNQKKAVINFRKSKL